MKLTGAKANVYFDADDAADAVYLTSGTTTANAWYQVMEKGEGSDLPLEPGYVFQAPGTGADQITLKTGDKIKTLDQTRFCKTSADMSLEEGTVDVGDDCDPGATILDGLPKASGSLAGLFRYNDETQEFERVTDIFIGKFFDVVEDDGAGIYRQAKRSNTPVYLMICLNSEAKVGQVENWACVPIIISSMSVSLGNTDAQNQSLSWSKGEGPAVIYKRVKTA